MNNVDTLNHNSIPMLFGFLALVLILARFAGKIAMKIGLPSVLGELILGILLGALPKFGASFQHNPALIFMTELGALLLLFEVGLQSSFSELKRVGPVASRVALVGIFAPLVLGMLVSSFFGATSSLSGHMFIGSILAATSVGITARVLRDLGQSQSPEAKVILAAAIFDDILGLILLAIVTAIVNVGNGGELSFFSISLIFIKSFLFIFLALALGRWLVPILFGIAARFLDKGALLTTAFGLCLFFSMLAHLFGLAPIIGAFFAGLVIQPHHFASFQQSETILEEQLEPVSTLFIPLFFVFTGMKVDLSVFTSPNSLKLGIILSIAAIIGKVLAGAAASKNTKRLLIGVGMVPRGEVGLIFASVGISLTLHGEPLLSPAVFGAIIIMVTITSIIAPIWLEFLLRKGRAQK